MSAGYMGSLKSASMRECGIAFEKMYSREANTPGDYLWGAFRDGWFLSRSFTTDQPKHSPDAGVEREG